MRNEVHKGFAISRAKSSSVDAESECRQGLGGGGSPAERPHPRLSGVALGEGPQSAVRHAQLPRGQPVLLHQLGHEVLLRDVHLSPSPCAPSPHRRPRLATAQRVLLGLHLTSMLLGKSCQGKSCQDKVLTISAASAALVCQQMPGRL